MTTYQKVQEVKNKFEREVVAAVITRTDLTLAQIAKMYGIGDEHVKYIMTKHGVPRRSPGRFKKEKATT